MPYLQRISFGRCRALPILLLVTGGDDGVRFFDRSILIQRITRPTFLGYMYCCWLSFRPDE